VTLVRKAAGPGGLALGAVGIPGRTHFIIGPDDPDLAETAGDRQGIATPVAPEGASVAREKTPRVA
jgi:hypothetical protein